ncbi:MAG: hypothetical protein DME19_00495 [Verrucomicrobia bacterium]|nr:MAG: hypothetical protein DME19_00495 [Verrucomicrobiota bacterium]
MTLRSCRRHITHVSSHGSLPRTWRGGFLQFRGPAVPQEATGPLPMQRIAPQSWKKTFTKVLKVSVRLSIPWAARAETRHHLDTARPADAGRSAGKLSSQTEFSTARSGRWEISLETTRGPESVTETGIDCRDCTPFP